MFDWLVVWKNLPLGKKNDGGIVSWEGWHPIYEMESHKIDVPVSTKQLIIFVHTLQQSGAWCSGKSSKTLGFKIGKPQDWQDIQSAYRETLIVQGQEALRTEIPGMVDLTYLTIRNRT